MIQAPCHPDRPHYAKGWCGPCYKIQRPYLKGAKGVMSVCHPDRPHKAKGLCNRCYMLQPGMLVMKRKAHIKCTYGVDPALVFRLEAVQQGMCGICGCKPRVLNIDHNHTTGLVRGLVCSRCNTGLGILEDPRYPALVEYLKRGGTCTI